MNTTSRSLLTGLALAPLLLAPGGAVDGVGYQPKEGATATRAFLIETDLTLEDMSLEFDGQDMSEMAGKIDMAMKTSQALEVTDQYEVIADGRPAKLKRSFDKVETSSHITVSNPMVGDNEADVPASSELEGATVLFSWNDSEEDFDVAFAEGEDGDEELLVGLLENMDLRGFLPGKEVSVGDTWKVPTDAVQNALRPGGDLKLKPESDSEDMTGMGDFSSDDLIESLEGEFEAEYSGTREEEGVRVGVIQLTLKAKCARDMSDKAGAMRDKMAENMPPGIQMEITAFDGELSYDAEGELLWNLESGLPHALSVSGDMRMIIDMAMSVETPDGDQSMEQSLTFAGTQTITLTTGE